jgi:hypothetical protein
MEQEMNVWGGGDLLQILLGTVERRERRGAAGSSRASREGYISGRGAMGIQQLLALRLPIVGAPPFTVAQCVRRSVHTNQRPNEIGSDQIHQGSPHASHGSAGEAWRLPRIFCNATHTTDNGRTFLVLSLEHYVAEAFYCYLVDCSKPKKKNNMEKTKGRKVAFPMLV